LDFEGVGDVIDVHPPHEPAHSWTDFLLHLGTITIGLLIALSLEGCVEWQHHRHLVHDAEASLQLEIENNAKGTQGALDDLHRQQATLKQDVVVLKEIERTHKMPEHGHIEVAFRIHGFEDVGWKTAQSTGALSYMPYDRAEAYSDIYGEQDALKMSEQQAARDTILALGPFLNSAESDPDPTPTQLEGLQEKIEVLQGQLLLVDTFMKGLDGAYKKFLAAHPQ
jgi:hypothetical protein